MKQFNKRILVLFTVILICVLGFLVYQMVKKTSELRVYVDNGEVEPKFSLDVEYYNVYVTGDKTVLKCSFKAEGCNEEISLTGGIVNKEIIYNDKVYKFIVEKKTAKTDEDLSNTTNLKVADIKGVPLNWVKEATIEIVASNYNDKNNLEYSFDGGITWQKDSTKLIKEPQVINAVVKESDEVSSPKAVEVKKVDSTKPVVKIAITKNEKGEVILSAVGGDDISAITSTVWNNEVNDKKLTITKAGKYKVVACDAAGNIEEDTVELEDLDNIETKRYVFFFPNGANGGTITEECTASSSNGSCQVTVPNITRSGYEILGWSTDPNDNTGSKKPGSTLNVDSTSYKKFYAITKKKVTVNFQIQSSNRAKLVSGQTSFSCDKYNQSIGCFVYNVRDKFPKVEGQNYYIFDGWNENKDSREASFNFSNDDAEADLFITENRTYYDMTYKPISVRFTTSNAKPKRKSEGVPNGYFYEQIVLIRDVDNGEVETMSSGGCRVYNNERSCSVDTLDRSLLHLKTSQYKILGWSTDNNAHEASVSLGGKASVSANIYGTVVNFYIVVQNRNPFVVTFKILNYKGLDYKNHSQADEVAKTRSCTIYNSETSCTVTNPILKAYEPPDKNYKYEFSGWSLTEGASTAKYSPSSADINVTESMNLYSVTSKIITNTFVPADPKAFNNFNFSYTKECRIFNNFDGESTCQTGASGIPGLTKDYTFVGWGESKTSTTDVSSGQKMPAKSENKTYYGITRREQTINFSISEKENEHYGKMNIRVNGHNYGYKYSTNCYEYNGSGKCYITVPKIESASDRDVILGWGDYGARTAIISTIAFNQNRDVEIRNYYSVSYDDGYSYTANFVVSKSIASVVGGENKLCESYNGDEHCTLAMPDVIISDHRYKFKGWSDKADQTTARWKVGEIVELTHNNTVFYSVFDYKPTVKTIEYEMNDVNALQDGRSVPSPHSCELDGNYNCPSAYTLPTSLPLKSGYEFVGWSNTRGSTTPSVKKGESIKIDYYTPTKYYAVTRKKVEIKYVTPSTSIAYPVINDSNATVNGSTATYYLYNGGNVKATIAQLRPVGSNAARGWSTTNNSHTANVNPNSFLTLTSSSKSTITYYSVTTRSSKDKIYFRIDDSLKSYVTSSYSESLCTIYNNESTCKMKPPTLSLTQSGINSGYSIVGWNTNASATSGVSVDSAGEISVSVDGGVTYHAIIKKPITISFQLLDSKAFKSIPSSVLAPRTVQIYSGKPYSMQVLDLRNYVNSGYEFIGWSTGNASTSAEYSPGGTYQFSRTLTLYAITKKRAMTFKFKIQDTKAVTQQSISDVNCYTYNGNNDYCYVKLPSLTAKSGYNALGWVYVKSAAAAKSITSGYYSPGSQMPYSISSSNLGGSVTYYSVTRKSTPLTATFNLQNSTAASMSGNSTASCQLYNGATTCDVKSPTLTKKGSYEALGWNTSSSATSVSLDKGATASISSNTTYYSITRFKVKINFQVTKTSASKSGGNDTCYIYNKNTSCKVTSPDIKMPSLNGRYTPVGWDTNRNATSASWALNKQKSVTASDNGKTYYSIFSVKPQMAE